MKNKTLRFKFYVLRLHPALLSLLLIFTFWANGLAGLDRFPKIHEDESWQAAPGYTFWTEGHFGTELFAGFFGMEQHYYGFMPLFPIMVGAALHLFGLGLFQARLVPLILITLAVALTHRLGRRLFSPWHGMLAVAILVGWRIAGPFDHLVSGIPMADVARIVRYDSAVPLFGLLALLLFITTIQQDSSQPIELKANSQPSILQTLQPSLAYLLIGALIGLATLSHLYGAFWLPALGVTLLWLRGWRFITPALLMSLGFGLALTPWFLFVASGWEDFLNQSRNYSDRFGLLDVRFYLINLLLENERYDPILNGARQSVGAWVWLVGCGLSLGWLGWRNIRGRVEGWRGGGMGEGREGSRFDPLRVPAQILLAVLGTLGSLFALLLSLKTFSYLAMVWPLFAIAIAAGFIHLWQHAAARLWWRPLLAALFALALVEGALTGRRMQVLVQQTTPYHRYTETVAGYLPPHSHLMGLQHYWLGLAEASAGYRSVLVPIFWTSSQYVVQPLPFAESVEAIPPDVLLLDQIMLDFLAATADPEEVAHPLHREIREYLAGPQITHIGTVEDPTYGRMEIYQLNRETVDRRR